MTTIASIAVEEDAKKFGAGEPSTLCDTESSSPPGWYMNRHTMALATTGARTGMKNRIRKNGRPLIRGDTHTARPNDTTRLSGT